ncbi:hypothetical protein [Chryseosolibacter indicus]|uniref:hypothetical protein n=1 Tax=Chryseosolibacter indicus TaxID=2782351 RepID=UPI0020B21DAD|nr:hypothetical protein [Chryseosolibacter indicus]
MKHSFGQRSKNGGISNYSQSKHKPSKVAGSKQKNADGLLDSKHPYHGLGLKFGDPFAITYKYYASSRFSFAADVGRASSGLYGRHFKDKFSEYIVTDTLSQGASLSYITHKALTDIIVEGKILYHIDITKISPGLQLYVGAGWEWKRTRLRYDFFYYPAESGAENEFGRFERTRITMGPQLVLGIEYGSFRIPVSAFMELEYFTDIQADPGWQRFEGGVGLRYIF